jgi:DNA-binding beta-propeller fold protein YncE
MRRFFMNYGHTRLRLIQACAVVGVVSLVAGCGNNYRPVITPVNSNGPAAQPQSYAVVVSAPSPTTPGIATIIDYSGDSVLAYAPIGPGPSAFTIDQTGSNGYTFDSDGTLSNFPISPTLQQKQVSFSTLSSAAAPVNLFSPSAALWAADLNGNVVDFFQGIPESFKLAIPVAPAFTPFTVIGPSVVAERNFVLSQNIPNPTGVECNLSPTTGPIGTASAIEISSYTISSNIPLGKCPVYAVENNDNRRFFVLNRGDDTVTVINSQLNTLDKCTPFVNQSGQTVTCHPVLPLSTAALTPANAPVNCNLAINPTCGMGAIAGPVYAEFNAATAQLIVANYDGNTISVIDVSEDQYGNDSPTFGTTYTIPVGNNPASVTVLADGSRAYTANQTDGTVSILDLSSHTVEKAALPVIGHPRTVVSTQNSEYGKVYAASPDSPYLTVIRTDLDIVDTTILVQGNIVDVRVSTQNGSGGNTNSVSRVPGYGQPCNLPPALEVSNYGAKYTLSNCQTLP